MKKIKIEIEDGCIKSIGYNGGWITFISDDGDEITLEEHTLRRGIAVVETDQYQQNIDQASFEDCTAVNSR